MKKPFISLNFNKTLQFLIIIGILSLCVTLVHKIQAQERENIKIENTTIEYQINKNTRNTELEQIKKEVNDEKIAALDFSDIKRNDKGEIIAISTQFKDESGSSQQKTEYNSMGINPFSIVIYEREKGEKFLEISNGNKSNLSQNNPYANFMMQQFPFDNDNNNSSSANDYFSSDFMELIKSMQKDMRKQQETFIQMMGQNPI
ncbi:hypothetical protein [Myroides indicus]|uniref:Uncharacterized protein n=1 Tax=Myroides indicus TaxID=1323422 RepID=A0A4R7EUK9_9FLAO|nr:hypothetical protein [Myroides indicus]TDS53343.1 hypothetical protein C8P70_12838 [Myroides indicus]